MQRKYFNAFALLVILAMVLGACAQPIPVAPAAEAPAASGETAASGSESAATGEAVRGGVWTRIDSADASIINPILSQDTASANVETMLYGSGLLSQNLESGVLECDENSFCDSYTVSDDGLVYTFKVKNSHVWNDGEPVTVDDYLYTYNAIADPAVESPRSYFWTGISSIEAPDAETIVITYDSIVCDAFRNIGNTIIPSHVFAPDFSDILNSPENEGPTVSNGVFNFQSWERDDNVVLVRNDAYFDGVANMDGMIFRVVPDAGARLAMLESGEADVLAVQPNQIAQVDANPNLTRYTWQDDGYTFIGMNYADPANPQNGRDADDNPIPQGSHPILGDLNVRRAVAYALDYDSIIHDIYFDQGYRQVANISPAVTWAYNNDLTPFDYDPEQASALLEEAGWVDSDGDGVREKDGNPLHLELLTNAGNSTRENLGAYVQDKLGEIGFDIDFQAIDFGTLLERMDSQTFDMYIIGWTNTGTEPTDYALFHSNQDIVGSGFNNISWYNERYEELSDLGNSVPGCAPEDRAQYYKEIQEVFLNDVPYVIVTGSQGNVAYNKGWSGIEPFPWSPSSSTPIYWNVNQWSLSDQ